MADHPNPVLEPGSKRWAFYVECWVEPRTTAMRFCAHIVLERRATSEDGELYWQRVEATPYEGPVLASYESARAWAVGWMRCAHDVRTHWVDNDERMPPFPVTALEPEEVSHG